MRAFLSFVESIDGQNKNKNEMASLRTKWVAKSEQKTKSFKIR